MNTETIIAEMERFQKRFAVGDSKTIDAAVTSLRSLGRSLSRLYTVLPAHRRDRIGGAA